MYWAVCEMYREVYRRPISHVIFQNSNSNFIDHIKMNWLGGQLPYEVLGAKKKNVFLNWSLALLLAWHPLAAYLGCAITMNYYLLFV